MSRIRRWALLAALGAAGVLPAGAEPVAVESAAPGRFALAPSGAHFVAADGRPVLWLADTWWFCPSALCPIDGSSATGIPSMFRALVDLRASQGFNVIQMAFLGGAPRGGAGVLGLYRGESSAAARRDYWAEISTTPIHAEGNGLVDYVQIQHDVSVKVERERALAMEQEDTAARLHITETLQQSSPLSDRCRRVLDILFGLGTFGLQRKGGIFLKAENEDCLNLFVLEGKFSDEFIRREQTIPMGACLCGRSAVSGEILVSGDCFSDFRHEHRFAGMEAHGHYIVPIASGGDVLGVDWRTPLGAGHWQARPIPCF